MQPVTCSDTRWEGGTSTPRPRTRTRTRVRTRTSQVFFPPIPQVLPPLSRQPCGGALNAERSDDIPASPPVVVSFSRFHFPSLTATVWCLVSEVSHYDHRARGGCFFPGGELDGVGEGQFLGCHPAGDWLCRHHGVGAILTRTPSAFCKASTSRGRGCSARAVLHNWGSLRCRRRATGDLVSTCAIAPGPSRGLSGSNAHTDEAIKLHEDGCRQLWRTSPQQLDQQDKACCLEAAGGCGEELRSPTRLGEPDFIFC